jgi:hypothetical protein
MSFDFNQKQSLHKGQKFELSLIVVAGRQVTEVS